MNQTPGKKVFSKLGLSILTGVVAFYIVFCLIYAICYNIDPTLMLGAGYVYLDFALMFLFTYPLIFMLLRKMETTEIPKKKMNIGMLIAIVPICYTIMILFNILGLVINLEIGKMTGKGIINPIINVVNGLNIWAQLLIVVVVGPIFEELIFRKLIIDRVYKYGELLAICTSALMFGLFHGNMQQFIYAFGAGFFMAFIYCKTGKIGYTMYCHMCMNFMGTLPTLVISSAGLDVATIQKLIMTDVNAYMKYVYTHMEGFAMVGAMGLGVLAVLIAGIVLMIVFHKKFKFERRETDLRGKEAWGTFFANTGMILYAVWWIVNIVMVQLGCSISSLLLRFFLKLF